MVKKLLCVFLSVVLCFAFVACNGGSDGNSGKNSGNTPSGEAVSVKVVGKGFGKEWMENIASAYYEETGTQVYVSEDPDLTSNLLTLMNNKGSEKEDIYFVGHSVDQFIKWIRQGSIESIDDVLASDKYGPSAKSRVIDQNILGMGEYKGKTYLTSYTNSAWGLIYNQSYLDKIDSYGEYKKGEWPETVQGLIDLCKVTKAANLTNNRTKRTVAPFSCGLTVDYMDWLYHGLWYELDPEGYDAYYQYSDVNGGYPGDKLVTGAAKQALETIYDLIDPKVATDDKGKSYVDNNLVASAQDHMQSQQSFVNGDCVFTFSGSWFGTEMKQILSEVGLTEYHFGAYPVYNKGDKTVVPMNLPGEMFFIPSDAINVSGAKDFLAFVLSEKGVAAAEKALQFPMVYSTSEKVEFNSFGKEIVALTEKSNLIYRFAKSDVFRTKALEIFTCEGVASPFIRMARNEVKRENLTHDILDVEKAYHVGLWSEWMKKI